MFIHGFIPQKRAVYSSPPFHAKASAHLKEKKVSFFMPDNWNLKQVEKIRLKIGQINYTSTGSEKFLSTRNFLFPLDKASFLTGFVDKLLFPDSFTEAKMFRVFKGNFLEEQNVLEIMLGCFRAPVFVCAGEAMPELCAEDGALTHWSKIVLYSERTCCSRFAISSSSNSISEIRSLVWKNKNSLSYWMKTILRR